MKGNSPVLNVNPNPISNTCQLNNLHSPHHGVDGQTDCGLVSSKRGRVHTPSPRLSFEGVTTAPAPTVQPDEKTASKSRAASSLGIYTDNPSNSPSKDAENLQLREEQNHAGKTAFEQYEELLTENPRHKVTFDKNLDLNQQYSLFAGTGERISNCSRFIAPRWNGHEMESGRLDIGFNLETNKASFSGLARCESRSCVICANTKAQETRAELSYLLDRLSEKNKETPLTVMLVTATMAHQRADKLEDIWVRTFGHKPTNTKGAWQLFTEGGAFARWKDENNCKGFARTVENPYGKNGWHVHIHALFVFELEFVKDSISMMVFEDEEKKRWMKCVAAAGGSATYEAGLKIDLIDIEDRAKLAEYLSKDGNTVWGAESEMTLGNYKITAGRNRKSFTAFELLRASRGNNGLTDEFRQYFGYRSNKQACDAAGRLFIEFHFALKGQRRVSLSSTLKAYVSADYEDEKEAFVSAQEALQEANRRVVASVQDGFWYRAIMRENPITGLLPTAGDYRPQLVSFFSHAIVHKNPDILFRFLDEYFGDEGRKAISLTDDFYELCGIHPPERTVQDAPPQDAPPPVNEELRPAILQDHPDNQSQGIAAQQIPLQLDIVSRYGVRLMSFGAS